MRAGCRINIFARGTPQKEQTVNSVVDKKLKEIALDYSNRLIHKDWKQKSKLDK